MRREPLPPPLEEFRRRATELTRALADRRVPKAARRAAAEELEQLMTDLEQEYRNGRTVC